MVIWWAGLTPGLMPPGIGIVSVIGIGFPPVEPMESG